MKSLKLGLIGALAVAGAAYGQQPPDVVVSDANANTAMGTDALLQVTPSGSGGSQNTAAGYQALYANTTGHGNTAVGVYALNLNSAGVANSAFGTGTLINNTTGNLNTAVGIAGLSGNQTGNSNTALGVYTLGWNTTGSNNTAAGSQALFGAPFSPTNPDGATGSNNTGIGASALYSYTTGYDNTASGYEALYSNTTGSNNIAAGYQAGYNLTTGSNNIEIGNKGSPNDHNTIRIGSQGTQAATFVAGIYNVRLRGNIVVVTPNGQLGVAAGFPPILLKELQKQAAEIRALTLQQIRDRQQQVSELKDLKEELHAALIKLQAKDELVAQR
jgi:hypothetical protein